jgi:hypothetical protein
MYPTFLFVHSVLRWAVILTGLVAAGTAWREVSGFQTARSGLAFTALLDLQVLAGLMLYFLLSPVTHAGIRNLGTAMSNDVLRFWVIEHPVGMLAALVLAHVARVKSRHGSDVRQRRRVALFFSIAIAIIILTTPWPFLPYGRPLI